MQSNQVSIGQSGLAAQYNNLRDDAYGGSILRPHQQGTPGMTLYVEPGSYFINGTLVKFGGGNTPTFTAPMSHPRIDIVTVDNSGTVAITQGTEASSPVTPAYPENKIVLCEVYNVVAETAIYTTNNAAYGWTSSQGYIQNDSRSFLQFVQNPSAFASDIIPDTTDTRNLGSSGSEWETLYAKNVVASSSVTQNGQNVAFAKYGGTGADGALTVTSGATNINLGGAAVFVKNYSSISITGTGSLTFSNPAAGGTLIIFKCAGNCTITSSASPVMDLSGLGGAGGLAVTTTGGSSAGGNSGDAFGQWTIGTLSSAGGGGFSGTGSGNAGGGGASSTASGSNGSAATNAGTAPALLSGKSTDAYIRYPIVPGGGGGSGGNGFTGVSGAGGAGGGSIVFEVAGALNITSAFKSNGGNGGTTSNATVGGGGGGGAGFFFFIYNTLVANSATFTTTGGTGGTGGSGTGTGGAGANGGSSVVQNQVYV